MEEGDCGLLLPPEPKSKDGMFSLTQVWSRILTLAAGVLFFLAFVSFGYFVMMEVCFSPMSCFLLMIV